MTWGTLTNSIFSTPTRITYARSPKEDALNTSPTPTKTGPSDTIGSFDGKPATATIAATDPLNTLGNQSQTVGRQSADGQRMEQSPPVPNTTPLRTANGANAKRLTSLSGLLKADNVDNVLYVADYATIEIKVTFQNGAKDSKSFSAGDAREMAVAFVMLNDNPLEARGSFFDVSAKG